ncbi:MAG: hypothetical protein RIS64_1314 [Bacteroidota bacterium]|jgi:hypothetical protein
MTKEITTKNKVLSLYPIDYPFETLFARATANPRKLILNPDFQRKYKWDKEGHERGSKFIESCLMRIPIPACYLAELQDNTQDVIDGVQRITTIVKFFNNEFELEGLTTFAELNGKKFKDLGNYASELEATTMRCIVLRKENSRELVKEIFARLNQGSVLLTPQEIRHAIYPGSLDTLLQELKELPMIKNFKKPKNSDSTKDGLEDEEMILRFFAMRSDLSDYDSKLSKYLDNYMQVNQNLNADKIQNLKILFVQTLQKCESVFDTKIFTDLNKIGERQGLLYYDLLMWSFQEFSKELLLQNKEKIQIAYQNFCKSEEFRKTLSGNRSSKPYLIRRRNLWLQQLKTIIG